MKGSKKFGIIDLLACIGYGFAASFLLAVVLLVTAPQVLAGGHTEGAGGLDNLMKGLTIVFFGGGVLFSLAAGWVLSRDKKENRFFRWLVANPSSLKKDEISLERTN